MINDVRRAFPNLYAYDGGLDPRDYERRWLIGLARVALILVPWAFIVGMLWLVLLAIGLPLSLGLVVLLCAVFCCGVAAGVIVGYFVALRMLKDERKYGQDSCNLDLN